MKMKKLLALFMAGAMTLSLAACGSGAAPTGAADGTAGEKEATQSAGNTGTTTIDAEPTATASGLEGDLSDIIPDKTVTLDVYDQLANYSGEQTGCFGKIMLDKFNVKLNIIP